MSASVRYKKQMEMLPTVNDLIPTEFPRVHRDPQLFYDDFGHVEDFGKRDPQTGRPAKVTHLAPYQIQFWKSNRHTLAVKSNKIGLSTSSLIECFQKTLLPETAGGEIIVGAQDQDFANKHIQDLKMMIKRSPKYAHMLIENPQKELLREMQSKVSAAIIRNPYDPKNPSWIVGVGQSPGRTFSWKRIVHVLLSDISLMVRKDWHSYWRGIYTRVALTNGLIKIESVPAGQQGLVWQLYKTLKFDRPRTVDDIIDTDVEASTFVADPESLMPTFKLFEFNADLAIAAGVMSQKFIDNAQRDLSLSEGEFDAAFYCKFVAANMQWYKEAWFQMGGYGIR